LKTLDLGVVLKPHGLRGELKVRMHWPQSTALYEVPRVQLSSPAAGTEWFEVESVRSVARALLVKVASIDDLETAESWRGARLAVERSALPDVPGEFYLVDLIGAEVTYGAELVGAVVEVKTHPTVDSLVIQRADGSRLEQPLVDHWVRSIDARAQRIELASLEGLIS
jgi:16S rRNA processing protein RimM